jgi:bifunctional UDP-N-acetylglucosamine pyrophosphorylase/glucosamine-1-phosphate N-acetyltransferase
MKSRRAKVLHEIAGRSLVEHVVGQAIRAGCERVVVVVGVQADDVCERLRRAFPDAQLDFVEQTERLGTGDAVARAEPALRRFGGDALLLCGDVPGLTAPTMKALVSRTRRRGSALTVLTALLDDPSGYGRVVRGPRGRVEAIVEHEDASAEIREIREINTGTYCASWPKLVKALARLSPDNAQGEYYLTDAVRLLLDDGHPVDALVHDRADDCQGVNSRAQLCSVGRTMNQRILASLMDRGVTVLDPATTWVHDTARVGRDTVLHPGVTIEGTTTIGESSVVHSGSRLRNVKVGSGVTIKDHTIAEDAEIGSGSSVGPFAHLRPGTSIGRECKIGNFVETKKARFGQGAKASHLSYIGDAKIGKSVNIGAGTITCNYDGEKKHLTELGEGVFIGSDTQLVAPVRVGRGSYVGAGTTVTKDVPPGSLAISRADQRNIEGWVERRKKRREQMAKEKK